MFAGKLASAHLKLEADRDVPLERVADGRRLQGGPQVGDLFRARAPLRLEADGVRGPLVTGTGRRRHTQVASDVEVAVRLDRQVLNLDPEQRRACDDDLDIAPRKGRSRIPIALGS
jgi:hypothetical protein